MSQKEGSVRCTISVFVMAMVAIICSGPPASAEVLFMPGDAFFSGFVREQDLNSWRRNQDLVVEYWQPTDCKVFNGFAGFERLKLIGNTEKLKEVVEKMYVEYEGRRKEVKASGQNPSRWSLFEDAPLRIAIDNHDFNIQRRSLFLRYNETWNRLADTHPEDAMKVNGEYCPFVPNNAVAVLEDWTLGPKVRGLDAEYRDGVKWWIKGRPHGEMAQIDVSKIRVFFPMLGSPEDFYMRRADIELFMWTPERLVKITVKTDGDGKKSLQEDVVK